ncbi:MAG TPA: hypothetical protein VFI90_06890 [Rubrobacter sp.]|nr:hypothetical protein [Rubrobacter sp.]
MDTRDKRPLSGGEGDQHYEQRGLGPWIGRNPWLLMRLFTVIVFSFAASTVAANFSYGLEGKPTVLSAAQIESGKLPAGTEIGDYVQVSGTPNVGEVRPNTVGRPESGIAIVSRYSTSYFYFRLQETGDYLLIQTTQGLPEDLQGERVWRGKLETVGTVIFHDTTQDGLKNAGLPRDESIPVVNTGETPEYLRKIFPAYSAIIVLWLLSVAWLAWKKNKPLLGL